MMESEEDIISLMDTMGDILTFPDFTIKGIPGFDTSLLYKGEQSVYVVEKQNFAFMVSTKDVSVNGIKVGDTFTYTDRVYVYTFEIDKPPVQDLTGYSELKVNYVSKEDV